MERYHIFRLGLAVLFYAAYCVRPMVVNGQKTDAEVPSDTQPKKFAEEDLVFYQGVQGKPGVDFPVLARIPRTSFSCRDVDSGYYADLETDCQVFHICEDNKKISFLCPNGTIFQQSELICEWWFKVNCTDAPSLYEESAEQLREDNARRKLSRRVQHHGAVMRTEERSSVSAVRAVPKKTDTRRDDFDQSNDLSRASSSDFVRDRGGSQPSPFQKQRDEEGVSQRGRKPVQFQQQASVDNEGRKEERRVAARKQSQRVVTRKPVYRGRVDNQYQKDDGQQSTARENFNQKNNEGGQRRTSTRKQHVETNQDGFPTNGLRQTTSFGTRTTESANQRVVQQSNRNDHGRRISTDFSQQFSFDGRNRQFGSTTERRQFSTTTEPNKRVSNEYNNIRGTKAFKNYEQTVSNDAPKPSKGFETSTANYFDTHRTFDNHNYDSFNSGSTQKHTNDVSNLETNNRNHNQNRNNNFVSTETQKLVPPSDNNERLKNHKLDTFSNTRQEKALSTTSQHNFNTGTTQEGTFTSNKFNSKDASNLETSNRNQNQAQNRNNDYVSTETQKPVLPSDNNERLKNRRTDTFPNTRQEKAFSTTSQHHFNSGTTPKQAPIRNQFSSDDKNQNQPHTTSTHTEISTDTNRDDFVTQKSVLLSDNNERLKNHKPYTFPNIQQESAFSTTSQHNFNSGTTQETSTPKKFNSNVSNLDTTASTLDQNQAHEKHQTTTTTNEPAQTPKPVPLDINDRLKNHKPYSVKQEQTVGTTSQHKNLNVDGKDGTLKQKSTVSLTKNDIVNRRLEGSDSDEAQITQETASFYKNSFNRIDQNYKSTPNPHPNHREIYSELREPKYHSTKSFAGISSVTPQYLTTQSINSGRPFVGSQVGTTLKQDKSFSTTTSYFISTTTTTPTTETTTTDNPATTTVLPTFSTARRDKSFSFSTQLPTTYSPKPTADVTIPAHGSFNLGTTSTHRPKTESSTGRVVDHATVYGKFVKSAATPPSSTVFLSKSPFGGVTPKPFSVPSTLKTTTSRSSGRTLISLSKSLFGATPAPFSKTTTGGTTKTSAEILSVADSFNRGVPQVRFFGKVQTTTKIPGVELHFNGNSVTSFSTTARPFSKSTTESFSTTSKPFSGSSAVPLSVQSYEDSGTVSTTSASLTSTIDSFGTTVNNELSPTLYTSTINPEFNSVTPTVFNYGTETPFVSPSTTLSPPSTVIPQSGFFVTRTANESTQRSLINDIVRPRPFQLPPEPQVPGKPVYAASTTAPTHPTYKISSASPFSTPEPTQPTPFTTTVASTFENVDSMISALAEMASNFSEPRPGLVIPPSAGPQTLHTLAVYFANALDGIAKEEDEEEGGEKDEESLTKLEAEKKRLTELLTQMTMDRYNELFSEEEAATTTAASEPSKADEDLEGQHSKGPAQTTPKVRQLAKVFTQALSSYLDDPATFKRVLEEVRPTEPPASDDEDLGDDELLNFSDADSKASFPPFYPTPSAARPTWGYLVAYNSTNLDVKNAISPDLEHLQGADSQSFVSQFNRLHESTTRSSTQLPEDHWTTSPDVDKLWTRAFAFDPASINENFGTTEATATTHQVKYELHALPQLELNSTQVHGILIDFMNATVKADDSRLRRILKRLNTTEDEFLEKMREIEGNPLTRRLILLLISECGEDARAVPVRSLVGGEALGAAGSGRREAARNADLEAVDPGLGEDSQDARALQLLNSLYTIASKFGK